MKPFRNIVLSCALLGVQSVAHAGLLGDQIAWQYYAYGDPFVVGGSPGFFTPGVSEDHFADQSANYFTVSGNDSQIIFDEFGASSPWSPSPVSLDDAGLYIRNGVLLYNFDAPISGVFIDASTNMVGMTMQRITFSSTSIAIDWAEVGFPSPGGRLVLNVSVVPEPASALMFAGGLLCLGFLRRRRIRSTAEAQGCPIDDTFSAIAHDVKRRLRQSANQGRQRPIG